jgi:hypothetical protein
MLKTSAGSPAEVIFLRRLLTRWLPELRVLGESGTPQL